VSSTDDSHSPITVYNASTTTVPKSVVSIHISHALLNADHITDPVPPHIDIALDNGVPCLVWGKVGRVEVAVVNIRQTHPDLERRDVDVYIKPGNPLAAAPGLFLVRRATLLARATLLKTNTTQVILSDDAAIPTGDEVPWPVVDWYVHDALGVARPTGVLALGNWPTLAGHLQLLAEDPPPVVLGHLGEMDAADLQTKTLKAMQDSIHPCLSTGLRRLVRECVVRGEPTWIPYLHQNWRRERQAIEQRAAERVLRREEAERAKQAKPKAERKPKKAGAKAAPPAAGEGAPAEREGAQPEEEEEEEPAASQEEAP
jgi:hypothetical protein